jgi:hypothetical protein
MNNIQSCPVDHSKMTGTYCLECKQQILHDSKSDLPPAAIVPDISTGLDAARKD